MTTYMQQQQHATPMGMISDHSPIHLYVGRMGILLVLGVGHFIFTFIILRVIIIQ